MIDLQGLELTLPGGRKLFDGLCWRVDKGQKVGLMGRNGEGKTTLLRLLIGEREADGGVITLAPKKARVGYLPQDLAELPDDKPLIEHLKTASGFGELERQLKETENDAAAGDQASLAALGRAQEAYERAGGYAFESLAFKTLSGLGFKAKDGTKLCGQFSGGWRMRISLAVLLLSKPDILLLDEPTNHLDTESMEWLENRLKNDSATMVIISHDRTFMDKIVTSVGHLQNGKITVFSGNYSHYLQAKDQWVAETERANQAKAQQIAHLQSFVDRFRYKDSKAKQAQARLKMIEKLGPLETSEEKQNKLALQWPSAPQPGRWVLQAENLSKSYSEPVFDGLNLEILKGEKIALVGYNGSGKSTLSRLLAGVEQPDSGTVRWGHQVQLARFAQEAAQNLNYSGTVWDQVGSLRPDWSQGQRRGLLGRFGFEADDLSKRVSDLSGGEKSRLALAQLTMTPSNFLLLDEPTNHLDAHTKELFQQAVLRYPGTLLLVSHDRGFLNSLATRVWELRDGALYSYEGNYDAYLAKKAALTLQTEGQSRQTEPPSKEDRRQAAVRRNALYRKLKPLRDRLAEIEEKIAALENEQTQLEEQLCNPGSDLAAQTERYGRLQTELAQQMTQWEELMSRITDEEEAHKASEGERP